MIGDSFTHGACVNEPDTIGGNLRKNIKSGGVLNLGQGGNGPLIEYATLREYLPLTKTERVLWIYYEGNDLWDLTWENNSETLKKTLEHLEIVHKDILSIFKKNNIDIAILETGLGGRLDSVTACNNDFIIFRLVNRSALGGYRDFSRRSGDCCYLRK